MVGENGVPETPDWVPTPRSWDATKCCPTDCALCSNAPTEDHIERGDN